MGKTRPKRKESLNSIQRRANNEEKAKQANPSEGLKDKVTNFDINNFWKNQIAKFFVSDNKPNVWEANSTKIAHYRNGLYLNRHRREQLQTKRISPQLSRL